MSTEDWLESTGPSLLHAKANAMLRLGLTSQEEMEFEQLQPSRSSGSWKTRVVIRARRRPPGGSVPVTKDGRSQTLTRPAAGPSASGDIRVNDSASKRLSVIRQRQPSQQIDIQPPSSSDVPSDPVATTVPIAVYFINCGTERGIAAQALSDRLPSIVDGLSVPAGRPVRLSISSGAPGEEFPVHISDPLTIDRLPAIVATPNLAVDSDVLALLTQRIVRGIEEVTAKNSGQPLDALVFCFWDGNPVGLETVLKPPDWLVRLRPAVRDLFVTHYVLGPPANSRHLLLLLEDPMFSRPGESQVLVGLTPTESDADPVGHAMATVWAAPAARRDLETSLFRLIQR
jgi:hypothetical protein